MKRYGTLHTILMFAIFFSAPFVFCIAVFGAKEVLDYIVNFIISLFGLISTILAIALDVVFIR